MIVGSYRFKPFSLISFCFLSIFLSFCTSFRIGFQKGFFCFCLDCLCLGFMFFCRVKVFLLSFDHFEFLEVCVCVSVHTFQRVLKFMLLVGPFTVLLFLFVRDCLIPLGQWPCRGLWVSTELEIVVMANGEQKKFYNIYCQTIEVVKNLQYKLALLPGDKSISFD